MGKVVKYCNACDEGFAEKFGFCPNCGAQLQAFELNPVAPDEPAPVEAAAPEPVAPPPPAFIPVVEPPAPVAAAPIASVEPIAADFAAQEESNIISEAPEEPEIIEEPVVAPAPKAVPATTVFSSPVAPDPPVYRPAATETVPHYVPDDGYSPTIVYDKNVGQRNMLLLGAFALCVVTLLGSYVYSMFNKMLDLEAIDTPTLVGYVESPDDPVPVEEVEPEKKKPSEKEDGGGGGGGKEEETPASKGRMATQVDNPLFAPSSKMDRVTDPAIAIQAATQGNKKAAQTDENYGLTNGRDGRSDGMGSGGGLGDGRGRGQGNGQGTGQGNGIGSGSGNGNGDGNGDGDGDGDGPTVKEKPVGPTEGLKILSKPRANYTDAARQANVQGKVVLRVTFSANGSIGAITVISGLGSGLTEQAIAAAKAIRFEPAKRGGVPYSIQRPIEYSFTIY